MFNEDIVERVVVGIFVIEGQGCRRTQELDIAASADEDAPAFAGGFRAGTGVGKAAEAAIDHDLHVRKRDVARANEYPAAPGAAALAGSPPLPPSAKSLSKTLKIPTLT